MDNNLSIEEIEYFNSEDEAPRPARPTAPPRHLTTAYHYESDNSSVSPRPFPGRGRARGRRASVVPQAPGAPIRTSSPIRPDSLNDLQVSQLAVDTIRGRGQPQPQHYGLQFAPATFGIQTYQLPPHVYLPPPPLFPQEPIPQPPQLYNTSFQLLEMTINRTVESENSDRFYESEHYEPDSRQFDDPPSDLDPPADSPDSPSYVPSDMSYQDISNSTDYYEEPSTDDDQALTPTAISPPAQTSPTTAAAGTAFQGLGVSQPQRFCEACRRRINTRPSGYRSE